jgi:hypothetical protein
VSFVFVPYQNSSTAAHLDIVWLTIRVDWTRRDLSFSVPLGVFKSRTNEHGREHLRPVRLFFPISTAFLNGVLTGQQQGRTAFTLLHKSEAP